MTEYGMKPALQMSDRAERAALALVVVGGLPDSTVPIAADLGQAQESGGTSNTQSPPERSVFRTTRIALSMWLLLRHTQRPVRCRAALARMVLISTITSSKLEHY